jgi:hypothetical protein
MISCELLATVIALMTAKRKSAPPKMSKKTAGAYQALRGALHNSDSAQRLLRLLASRSAKLSVCRARPYSFLRLTTAEWRFQLSIYKTRQ